MNRNRYGILAGLAGAALAAWYWRSKRIPHYSHPSRGKGEVIYRNTPAPSEGVL